MMLHRIATKIAPLVAAGTLLAACGSESDSTSSSAPATDVAPSTEAVDDGTAAIEATDPDEPEITEEGGECAEDECNDVDEPVDTILENVEPDDPFVPASADLAFCLQLDEFDDEEQPADDAEAALFIQDQMARLLAVAPDQLSDDLALFDDFIGRVVAGEATLDEAQIDPSVSAAGDRLSEFIEVNCEGDTPSAESAGEGDAEVPKPDEFDEVELANGVVIPVLPIDGEVSEVTIPYFGDFGDDGSAATPEPGFVVEPELADFCLAVDIINHRPQPVDEFEDLVIGEEYLLIIESTVPDELAEPYQYLLDWLGMIADNGSFDGIEEPEIGGELDMSVEAVNEFVNTNCLGR